MPLIAHFLNVGHGDCTVIEHPSGNITIVDINNGDDLDFNSRIEIGAEYGIVPQGLIGIPPNRQLLERRGYGVRLTNPIEFITRVYPNRSVFRYIQTHPDLDHMRGIGSLIQSGFTPTNFWDTDHRKEPDLQNADVDDWETYLSLRNGHHNNVTILKLTRGVVGKYYNRDANENLGGDGIEILSPSEELINWANQNEKWNELSYVIRISHGGRNMILGGDAGETAWENIYGHYGDELSCQVLKASHHGRNSGYYQPAVQAMSPSITIVSVGKKPSTDASNLYRRYCDDVWSTRWKGNITVTFPDNPIDPFLYSVEYER